MTTEAKETQAQAEKSDKGGIAFTMPAAMKEMVQAAAQKANIATGAFARQVLAQAVGFKGDLSAGREPVRKYASAEERKEAAKKRREDRNALFDALLARYEEDVKAGKVQPIVPKAE